ncbi:MAG: ABC transporter substrate-binding protein [Campylobacterales bacterium]|nr:ABC transporter substrate-binding protein [Campylobacterales bacterium]
MKKILEYLLFISCLVFTIAYFCIDKEPKTIKLGQTCPLSGSSAALGIEMMQGANTYFEYINKQGGINGKKIELISYDDKYEPQIATQNAYTLIKQQKVVALFANVGTPTAKHVLPMAIEENVPFITPFTGAKLLREPFNPLVINLRASYEEELRALVNYLVTTKKVDKIAVFYQNDSFGTEGVYGAKKALAQKGLKPISSGSYNRNTLSVQNAIYEISLKKPEAIIMIAPYEPSAEFVKKARENYGLRDTIFCATSFAGSKNLEKELKNKMKNIIVSQVLPNPEKSIRLSIQLYRQMYKKSYPNSEYSYVSLEGFLSAMLTVKALQNAKSLNSKAIIEAFEKLPMDALDGFEISLSKDNHQALSEIFITDYNTK